MNDAKKAEAKALVDQLAHFVNSMTRANGEAFASALAEEHPTLLGQIAKYTAIGVMRRADANPDWKPYDERTRRLCLVATGSGLSTPDHGEHDGRLSCGTVYGAEFMARQGFV